jgi:hypothetical protein
LFEPYKIEKIIKYYVKVTIMNLEEESIILEQCFVCAMYGCDEGDHKKDLKTLAYIKKARGVNGWRYGYARTVYIRSIDNLIITCIWHGDYEQRAVSHTQGKHCRKCARNSPEQSWENFVKNIEKLGGKVTGEYKGKDVPVECICKNGHICYPQPGNINNGQGMCKICVGIDSDTAKLNFYKNIERLGGKVIGVYEGNKIPVECLCPFNHICYPIPNHITNGQGMCSICAENDSKQSELNFYENIARLGGKVIGVYVNSKTPVECICKNGHRTFTIPSNIQSGEGMCKICVDKDFNTAKNRFIELVKKMGGRIMGEYKGNKSKVSCLCAKNHGCNLCPQNFMKSQELCQKCLACPSCGLWKTMGQLCDYCSPEGKKTIFRKTKEMSVVKFLRDKLPEEGFIHNGSVGRQFTGTHLYPDIRFDKKFYNLIIEIDEHKHSGSAYECDKKRMYDIIAKLETPCIFIRYNPDSIESDKNVLYKTIQKYINLEEGVSKVPWDDFGFVDEYLYY